MSIDIFHKKDRKAAYEKIIMGDKCLSNSAYHEAAKLFADAWMVLKNSKKKDQLIAINTCLRLANCLEKVSAYKESINYLLEGLSLSHKWFGATDSRVYVLCCHLSDIYKEQGDYSNSLIYYKQALEIAKKNTGTNQPNSSASYNKLASLYQAQGDYESAKKYYTQALNSIKTEKGTNQTDIAVIYNNLAGLYHAQGDYKQAQIYYNQALVIYEKVFSSEHPDIATTYNNLASLYQAQGDYENALKFYQHAIAINEKVLGKVHPDTAITYSNLASLYMELGDYNNSQKYFLQAVVNREKNNNSSYRNKMLKIRNDSSVELGKASLLIASLLIVRSSLATSMAVIGEAAGFLINCVNWDKESDNRIATAVQNALQQVKRDVPQGAQKIVNELLTSLDSPYEIDERIRHTESYLLQCETPQTRHLITEKFQLRFRMELRQYHDLNVLVSMLDGLIAAMNSIDQRLQKHNSALDTNERMITVLQAEMERLTKEPVLCLPGMTPGVKLIGRENDLAEFAQEAATQGKKCAVSGIGGVGKTQFIKAYLQERMVTLGFVGWFDYRNSFRDTLLSVPGLVLHSCAPADDPIAKYNEIMGLLRQLKAEDLLVFDNVSRVESSEDMEAILTLPCKVIFTTRDAFTEDRNRLLVYDIDFLSIDACAALFAHYRGEETPEAEQANLREVIRLAGAHTMALELLAKTCMAARLSVGGLLERLQRDGFSLDWFREEGRQDGGTNDNRLWEQMQKLFGIADIKSNSTEHPFTANTYNNLASLYLAHGDYENAQKYYRQAMIIHEKVLGKEHPDIAITYNNLANVYKGQGNYENAMYYYLQALAIREKMLGREHPDTARTYNNMATLYQDQGDFANALLFYRKAIAIREKVLDREHPDIADTYNGLATLYQVHGDYENALKYFCQAMAIRENVLGREHPDTAATYNGLATLYQVQGNYMNALQYYLQAMTIYEKVLGRDHPDTATTYNNLADLYSNQGDYDNALMYYLQAMSIREKVLGREHPDTASTYSKLAALLLQIGKKVGAAQYAETAYKVFLAKFGENHKHTKKAKELLNEASKE